MKLWQTFSQWSATSWTRLGCVLASVLALNSLGVVVSQTVPIIASLGYHVGSDGIARMLSWRFFATVGTVLIGTALKSGSLKTVFPPRVLAAVCLAIVATCGATLCQPSTTLSFPVFRALVLTATGVSSLCYVQLNALTQLIDPSSQGTVNSIYRSVSIVAALLLPSAVVWFDIGATPLQPPPCAPDDQDCVQAARLAHDEERAGWLVLVFGCVATLACIASALLLFVHPTHAHGKSSRSEKQQLKSAHVHLSTGFRAFWSTIFSWPLVVSLFFGMVVLTMDEVSHTFSAWRLTSELEESTTLLGVASFSGAVLTFLAIASLGTRLGHDISLKTALVALYAVKATCLLVMGFANPLADVLGTRPGIVYLCAWSVHGSSCSVGAIPDSMWVARWVVSRAARVVHDRQQQADATSANDTASSHQHTVIAATTSARRLPPRLRGDALARGFTVQKLLNSVLRGVVVRGYARATRLGVSLPVVFQCSGVVVTVVVVAFMVWCRNPPTPPTRDEQKEKKTL